MNYMQKKFARFKKNFLRDWQLYLFILIPAIYIAIFSYGPMYGIQIAFRDYNPADGINNSVWVGWKWFEKFFSNYKSWDMIWNTVRLSLYTILWTFPIPIMIRYV